MSLKPYKTLTRCGQMESVIKKSRFIGQGAPASSEEEALSLLREIRERQRGASHNCFAYIIGVNQGVMRYSDDGEPGGTAGLPIIEVLKAKELTDCLVVVTRYFGGVLLGAGGLTRAYAQGAAQAVDAAGEALMEPTAVYMVEIAYPMLGRVEHYLKTARCAETSREFAEAVTMELRVRDTDAEAMESDLIALSDGRIELARLDVRYHAWPV